MIKNKKINEVALPLEAINNASARAKSIRHGHPSTLHPFDRYKLPAFQEPFAGGPCRHRAHYLRQPFQREPDFRVTSVNYDFAERAARAANPCG